MLHGHHGIVGLHGGISPKSMLMCRELHRIPELAFEETRTAAYLQRELKALAIPFREGVAGTGIVATLGSGSPRVALRTDIDALPIRVRLHVSQIMHDDCSTCIYNPISHIPLQFMFMWHCLHICYELPKQ